MLETHGLTVYRGLFTPCSHSQRFFSSSCLGSPAGLRKALGKLLLGCVCESVYVCVRACSPASAPECVMSQWLVTHLPLAEMFPPGWTIRHCESSAGVSGCQLASVYYSCAVTGRQSWPSVTTLCKWVKEMKMKSVERGLLGSGVLLANSAQAPFWVLL